MRSVALLIAVAVAGVVGPDGARADGDKPPPLTCVVKGDTAVPAGTKIYDAGSAGNAIAKLTGATVPLKLSSFPAKPSKGRLRVATSKSSAAVRIEGWADVKAFRLYAASDLAVSGGHVWITKGQRAKLVGGSAKGFTVEHKVLGSDKQAVKASVGCSDVSLTIPKLDPVEVPKAARTYQMKRDTIELFAEPRGKVVFKLRMGEDTRKVFWSTEGRNGFVRVMSRSDITIDAWARYRDVTALRHGEIFDNTTTPTPLSPKKLAMKDAPEVLTADAEMPIHRKPENSRSSIGVVEVGATFYAMEQSGAWTNIMPASLAVLPPDGGGFWVRTASLPKPKPKPKE